MLLRSPLPLTSTPCYSVRIERPYFTQDTLSKHGTPIDSIARLPAARIRVFAVHPHVVGGEGNVRNSAESAIYGQHVVPQSLQLTLLEPREARALLL